MLAPAGSRFGWTAVLPEELSCVVSPCSLVLSYIVIWEARVPTWWSHGVQTLREWLESVPGAPIALKSMGWWRVGVSLGDSVARNRCVLGLPYIRGGIWDLGRA